MNKGIFTALVVSCFVSVNCMQGPMHGDAFDSSFNNDRPTVDDCHGLPDYTVCDTDEIVQGACILNKCMCYADAQCPQVGDACLGGACVPETSNID